MTAPHHDVPPPADADEERPQEGPKNLLTMPEREAATALFKLWKDLDPIQLPREAKWELNDLRRQGFCNIRLFKHPDTARVRVYPPVDKRGSPRVELMNKARRLCRQFVSVILADPPAPAVEPTSDSPEDRDAAETSTRALEDIQSPRRLNTQMKVRKALDRACTYGSGFVRYLVDPTAGGRHPVTIEASPLALDEANPLQDPATGELWGAIVPDPMDPTGQMMVRAEPPEPIERYVKAAGPESLPGQPRQLTDDPREADYEWRPGLRSEVADGRHIRFLPHTAPSRDDAHAVLIAGFLTVAQARGMFPEAMAGLDERALDELVGYRPENTEKLLPAEARKRELKEDERLIFCLTAVWRVCQDYEEGAYIVGLGGKLCPYRETWDTEVMGKKESLPLPVAQFPIFQNGQDDLYHDGLMDDLGGGNEVRAAQMGHLLAYLDRWNNLPILIPSTSTVTESDLYTKRALSILPGQEPKGIPTPGYEQASLEAFSLISAEMDADSQLQQAGQGLEDPSVKSGVHAQAILGQVQAGLSEPKENTVNGYLQCCDIELRLARAFGLDGETRWQGEDGRYKVKRWQGANLAGDVRLKTGTMTMLTPVAKAALVEHHLALGMISADQAQDLIVAGIGSNLGRLDDPFRLEIKRSLYDWEHGPPEGWMPPAPQLAPMADPATGAPVADAMGQPAMQPVVPVDPMAAQLFPPGPHHQLPNIAQLRVTEMARIMASTRYTEKPPEWRLLLDTEFQRMIAFVQAAQPAPQPPEEE